MCEEAVFQFCRSFFSESSAVLVAVSGGSDSVALLHILHSLQKRLSIARIGIAHINHGLRGSESDSEEAFVRTLSHSYGCKFHCLRLTDAPVAGIEEWARRNRYGFFSHVRAEHAYDWIATGHTRDDQVETVLMRMIRGAGITGLRGIHPVRGDGVIRPLLELERDHLRKYLRMRSLRWCEDSSNRQLTFSRNRIRHTVIPAIREQNTMSLEHIAAISQQARDIVTIVEPVVNDWIKKHVVAGKERFRISKDGFSQPAALVRQACAKLFRFYGISFSQTHMERIVRLANRSGGQFLFPSKWSCFPFRHWLYFCPQPSDKISGDKHEKCLLEIPGHTRCEELVFESTVWPGGRMPGSIDETNMRVYLDARCCGQQLVYRTIDENDTFQPLGSDKQRKALPYLKSRKVPVGERSRLGVVARPDGTVVWIPSVEISRKVRVDQKTESILEISCRYQSLINVF